MFIVYWLYVIFNIVKLRSIREGGLYQVKKYDSVKELGVLKQLGL